MNFVFFRQSNIMTFIANMLLYFLAFLPLPAKAAESENNTVEEEIWKLEENYFICLYKANYENMLQLVHPQFLGWPGNLPKPIDKYESSEFMRKLVPNPTLCVIKIERLGFRKLDNVALTHYILTVQSPLSSEMIKTNASRITHIWIKNKDTWQLLGGMSAEVKNK